MKLAAFTYIVPDYDAGIAIFCSTLGFELIEDIDQGHKRWITVRAPHSDTAIVLARASTPEQQDAIGKQGGGRVWLFLQTDDFEHDHAKLQSRGIQFEEEPRHHEPYGIVAVFRDPFGSRWDLIQKTE